MLHRPSFRLLGPGLALAVLLTTFGLLSPRAEAAPYSVWSCRGPNGAPVATTAWRGGGTPGASGSGQISTLADTCGEGGSLTATLGSRETGSENYQDDVSGYRLDVPATTRLLGLRVSLSAFTVTSSPGAYGAGVGTDDVETPISAASTAFGCPGTPAACSVGTPGDPLGTANSYESTTPAGAATLVARCGQDGIGSADATCHLTTGSPDDPVARVSLYRSEARFDGGAAPVVGAPTGSLVDPAGIRGPGHVEADVADLEGGVQVTALLIDGSVAVSRLAGGSCVEPYVVADPCPQQTVAAFGYDASQLTPGNHTARLRAVDASGAITDGPPATVRVLPPVPPTDPGSTTTTTVTTPAPPPPPPTTVTTTTPAPPPTTVTTPAPPTPPAAEATLVLDRTRIRAKRSYEVGGRVSRSDGREPGASTVVIASRPLGSPRDPFRQVGSITTAEDGTFATRRSAVSQELRFSVTLAGRTASDSLEVVQPLELSLDPVTRTLRNGGVLTLRGELDGAGESTEDTLVVVQAIVNGRWSAIDTVRAGEDGAIRWRYRFVRSPRAANYRFRFRIPERRGLPFRRETSPERTVRVRP